MTNSIHPTSIVDPLAKLGEGCTVGPYAIIEEGVEMGTNCEIEAHAIIKKWTCMHGPRDQGQPQGKPLPEKFRIVKVNMYECFSFCFGNRSTEVVARVPTAPKNGSVHPISGG